jgi:Chromo (CHRromatin Organisation MOdifier) domain/Integrase zinc binding domain
MSLAHDMPISGHRSVNSTLEKVKWDYFWLRMNWSVKWYVQTCDLCQCNKATNQKTMGLLQSLPIPIGQWTSVSMDFITHLLLMPQGFDAITVIVDRFTKWAHFIPSKMTDNAEDVAYIFIREVIRHHGIPSDIVSDRDTRFTSRFWTALTKMLGIQRCLSSSYHPETDGQTERTNRTLEELLRNYIRHDQTDWDTWLPIVEYAYNDTQHASMGMMPFYANYGQIISPMIWQVNSETNVDSADILAQKLTDITAKITNNLVQATKKQEHDANQHRQDFQFKIDELVLVKMTHFTPAIYTNLPNKKLMSKWVGPYRVIKQIGKVAYKLDIPTSDRVHPVFHISALRPYFLSNDNRRPERPPPIDIDTHQEYEVEDIIDDHIKYRRHEYLIKWKGYPRHEATWEPIENLTNIQQLLLKYRQHRQMTSV